MNTSTRDLGDEPAHIRGVLAEMMAELDIPEHHRASLADVMSIMPEPQHCRDDRERDELTKISMMGAAHLLVQCEQAGVDPYITDQVTLAKAQSLLELPS